MRLSKTLRTALVTTSVLVGLGAAGSARALSVQTVQFLDGAGGQPVWGQGITINVGATVADSLITPTVDLQFVGFRIADPTVGSPGRTSVYLHVYDDFGITAGGAVDPSAIGNLIGVSTNALNLEIAAPSSDLSWFFSGVVIAKDATYHYVLANDTVAATSTSYGNLLYSELETGAPNPHGGGQPYVETGDVGGGPSSPDVYFRVVSETVTVPEPSAPILTGLGVLGLATARRRRAAPA